MRIPVIAAAAVTSLAFALSASADAVAGPTTRPEAAATTQPAGPLPKLVDFGAEMCIPCKKMVPVLESLTRQYAGSLTVEFVNVNTHPERAKAAGVGFIPTQIFYDSTGKEIDRHVGFIPQADILARFAAKGVHLKAAPPATPPAAESAKR